MRKKSKKSRPWQEQGQCWTHHLTRNIFNWCPKSSVLPPPPWSLKHLRFSAIHNTCSREAWKWAFSMQTRHVGRVHHSAAQGASNLRVFYPTHGWPRVKAWLPPIKTLSRRKTQYKKWDTINTCKSCIWKRTSIQKIQRNLTTQQKESN